MLAFGYKDSLPGIVQGILFTVGAAFLFYRSWYALSLGAVIIPVYYLRARERFLKKRQDEIGRQFISGMQGVAGALMAGYSMENAWRNARRELERIYGKEAVLARELKRMEQHLDMNEPLEPLLLQFAEQTGIEDIRNFAEIFQYAKRSGGNLAAIIRTTINRMQDKRDVLAEIENAVASQRMEQRMMNLMFPGILLFVTISSPEYVSSLYHNLFGIIVMSGCLAGYIAACLWSEKLTQIEI